MAKNLRSGAVWLLAIVMEQLRSLTYLVDVNGQSWKHRINHLWVQSDLPSDSFHSDHEESSPPVLSSPESSDTVTSFSDSFESSNDVDPSVSSANVELNSLPKNISDEQISAESAGSSAQVPTRQYPSRVRKTLERYQSDPSN